MILLVLYSKVCLVSPDMKHTAIELALTLHSLYCLFVDKCNKVLCCFHVVKAQIRTVQTRDWNSSQIWHWHLNTICIDDRYTGRTLHVSDICHMIHETVAQADLHYIRYHNCCKSLFHSLHICLHTHPHRSFPWICYCWHHGGRSCFVLFVFWNLHLWSVKLFYKPVIWVVAFLKGPYTSYVLYACHWAKLY